MIPKGARKESKRYRRERQLDDASLIAFPQRGTPPPGESLRHLCAVSEDMPFVDFLVVVNITYDCFIAG